MSETLAIRVPRRVPWGRLPAVLLAGAALGMLVVGMVLTPRTSGFGTHEQLGLPPCGWLMTTGTPCPSCGMTTSVALLAHGRVGEALWTNPMGVVVAVLGAVVFWGAVHAAVTGCRIRLVGTGRLFGPYGWWTLGGVWLASWVYKLATWPG